MFRSVRVHIDDHVEVHGRRYSVPQALEARIMLESNAVPVLDAQGQLQGFQGGDRNIAQRVLGVQERSRLVAILEATSDIVGMADPEGHLIYLNQLGRAMFGIGPPGFLPKVIANVHPQWATELVLGEGLSTATQDGRWLAETAVTGPGGEAILVPQLILSHKNLQGKLLFLSTIIRDIRDIRDIRVAESRHCARARSACVWPWLLPASVCTTWISPQAMPR